MSKTETSIIGHYGQSGLYERIVDTLAAAGIGNITPEHLKSVDEFHIGGVKATQHLLDPLNFGLQTKVLDIGSGIGGPARFMARRYGCVVTGIDLTPDFVACAQALTSAVGLTATFQIGSALELPFEDTTYDAATLIHVGMNLPDKPKLFSEVARVLKPGGVFAVYDVMLFSSSPDFPLPWATVPEASFLQKPQVYLDAAKAAGLVLTHKADRGDVAKVFFADMQAEMAKSGPPTLGLPLLMGPTAAQKIGNMVSAIQSGDIQPVGMIFKKG